MSHLLPRIAITMGEPAGIGPDLLVNLAEQRFPARLVLIGDEQILRQRAALMGVVLPAMNPFNAESTQNNLEFLSIAARVPCQPGRLDPRNSAFVLSTIERAVKGCLGAEFDAMVTAPVHKGVINDAGYPFSGHTEYLAQLSDTGMPVMMLATPGLRMALATTHLPLAQVASTISRELLLQVLSVLHADLIKRFALSDPEIYVTGLNPHAGEQGHLGREEMDIIIPVLNQLRAEGMKLTGPLPADTAFLPANLSKADAFLAMYHDQGLPVLKYAGFGKAVNITLGLPFIRTSVDHGTALDLAGKKNVDFGSMTYAIETAIDMVTAAA